MTARNMPKVPTVDSGQLSAVFPGIAADDEMALDATARDHLTQYGFDPAVDYPYSQMRQDQVFVGCPQLQPAFPGWKECQPNDPEAAGKGCA
jgi:hypothetical protein